MSAMLTLVCCGLLCGAADLKAIWKKRGPLNQGQRAAVGLIKRCKKCRPLILTRPTMVNQPIALRHAVSPAETPWQNHGDD